jgi:hypothetical protein
VAEEKNLIFCFWRSRADGSPSNGGKGGIRKEGQIEEISGPLVMCGPGALHGTFHPVKYSGEALWVVALYPPIEVHDDKLGSLKRKIICKIPNYWSKNVT